MASKTAFVTRTKTYCQSVTTGVTRITTKCNDQKIFFGLYGHLLYLRKPFATMTVGLEALKVDCCRDWLDSWMCSKQGWFMELCL